MSSANKKLHFFLSVCCLFPFSCLMALARAAGMMLNRTDEREHPCLALRRKTFNLSPLSTILPVGFSSITYY